MDVPVPLHFLNPCRKSCNLMDSYRWSIMMETTFHSTYTSPILWYSPPPLGIRSTISHVKSNAYSLMSNSIFIISMAILHLEGSVFYSACSATIYIFKCSTRINDGPLDLLVQTRLTAYSISSLNGTLSVTSTGSTSTGLVSPGGFTRWYRSFQSCVADSKVTHYVGCGNAVSCVLIPTLRPRPHFTWKGGSC